MWATQLVGRDLGLGFKVLNHAVGIILYWGPVVGLYRVWLLCCVRVCSGDDVNVFFSSVTFVSINFLTGTQ